eukprot:15250147-Alexandrium_andersonii.AAC.1
MSASLVGSEMCIRDSLKQVRMFQGRSARQPLECQTAIGRRQNRALGDPPVSYTHLTLPTICSV